MMPKRSPREKPEYDVCLSFAGEDRPYVRTVATALAQKGVKVFYDEYEQVRLWGANLYDHLSDVYRRQARYCVIFISRHYAKKVWTNHERRSAQARALRENTQYILPVRFDKTQIPGLEDTVGYLDLKHMRPRELAGMILKKIGRRPFKNYFPPVPDELYRSLRLRSEKAKSRALCHAEEFMSALRRMSPRERNIIYHMLAYGCQAELPDNVHIEVDLLCRISGLSRRTIERLVDGVVAMGFEFWLKDVTCFYRKITTRKVKSIYIKFNNKRNDALSNATRVAASMVKCLTASHCEVCSREAFVRLDFSCLASEFA